MDFLFLGVISQIYLKRPLSKSLDPGKGFSLNTAFGQNFSVEQLGHRVVVVVGLLLRLGLIFLLFAVLLFGLEKQKQIKNILVHFKKD